jgi:hypothetical protein
MDGTPTQITNVPAPIIQQEFLRWLNTPEEVFTWIENTLRGKYLVITKKGDAVWKQRKGVRIMTDEGVDECMQQLRMYVNKFTFHADYTDDEIKINTRIIADNFLLFLARNWQKYEIESSVFFSAVLYEGIVNMIYSAYKMSGMRNFYENVLKVTHQIDPDKGKKKILGIFPAP